MNKNELHSVYIIAEPSDVRRLNVEGYTIIRHIKGWTYEARVTNKEQFKAIADRCGVDITEMANS
jgi:hypothetical protein